MKMIHDILEIVFLKNKEKAHRIMAIRNNEYLVKEYGKPYIWGETFDDYEAIKEDDIDERFGDRDCSDISN